MIPQANNGEGTNTLCPASMFSSQYWEEGMVFGFDDVHDYDTPDEKLLNSKVYKDAMIAKPEDVPEAFEPVIEHQCPHLLPVQPNELTNPTEPHHDLECITISVPEMAKVLGIGQNRAYDWAHMDGFPAIRSEGTIRVFKNALEDWLLEHPTLIRREKDSKKATEAKAKKKSTKASVKEKVKIDAQEDSESKTTPEEEA